MFKKIQFNAKAILLIVSFLFLAIGTAVEFKKTEKSSNNDFRVYYKTSQRIVTKDWTHIYTRDDGAMPYRYVPYTLMGLTWLSHYQEVSARKIWLTIQAVCFVVGFYFLYLSLVLLKSPWPVEAVCWSFLLTFRYYMDSLYCGQVAGFIFLFFSLGLYFYLGRKNLYNGLACFVPTSLKIIPGLLLVHAFIKAPGVRQKLKLVAVCSFIFLVANLLCYFWLSHYAPESSTRELFVSLWKNWVDIALADNEYFYGGTSKSQAIRGVLIRILGAQSSTERIWKIIFLLGISGVFLNWYLKKATTLYQDACSYCLGVVSFILFMPESLPYQIMKVAIPLCVLLAYSKIKNELLYKVTLVGFMIFMSFPSSDFIGRNNSDWIQEKSFPFLVLVLIFFILFKESYGKKDQAVKI